MTRREIEVTDINEIEGMLSRAKFLHLGLVDRGRPYIVPMNYGYEMNEGRLTLYLHSGMKGHKMDLIINNPDCCFELECDVKPFNGVKPCMNGMSYCSVMGRGRAEIIEGYEARKRAMNIFMKTQIGEEYEFSEKMLSAVHLIRVDVDEFTARKRPLPSER
ncbi:MAG: pyridoxamine 5'-phosphate oxidase family protein [Eubacteriales bacterium]|nr:pyridoxamine 5'-phosphate oxidase family protein [Eubacteriales bacterium]